LTGLYKGEERSVNSSVKAILLKFLFQRIHFLNKKGKAMADPACA
jgi:hypothetical protein